MLLRARIVYPGTAPPIADGAVRIYKGRIQEVGRFHELRGDIGEPVQDLGESVLLPGLVNAHCHLDYTSFAGLIPRPSGFTKWVQQLISLKSQCSYTEFASSWLLGLRQSIDHGATTLCDIEAVPELLPDLLPEVPIRLISCREIINVRSRKPSRDLVCEVVSELKTLLPGKHRFGLSPHAPYSTSQDLVRCAAEAALQEEWIWTIHVGESAEEQQMFEDRRGPMFEWLKSQRDNSDCGSTTPFGWLLATGALSPRTLIAHANCITEPEALAVATAGCHVVHCPKSHAYFSHPKFPLETFRRAGLNLCLGTDSLASHPSSRQSPAQLNLFSEMQAFLRAFPGASPSEVLSMATLHGAEALGLSRETGQITPGLSADLISLPWTGSIDCVAEAIVHHAGSLNGVMAFGEWVRPPSLP